MLFSSCPVSYPDTASEPLFRRFLKDVAPVSYVRVGDESQPSKSGSRARAKSRMGRRAALRNGLEDPVTQKVSESKFEWLR
jgi:hypothetical protein